MVDDGNARTAWSRSALAATGVALALGLSACSGEGISLPSVSRSSGTIVLPSPTVTLPSLPSLPTLQSLNIIQDGEPYGKISHLEGSHWYETVEGEFKEAPEKKGQKFKKSVLDGYMHSIVRAAPNLVELGLQASGLDVSNYVSAGTAGAFRTLAGIYRTSHLRVAGSIELPFTVSCTPTADLYISTFLDLLARPTRLCASSQATARNWSI